MTPQVIPTSGPNAGVRPLIAFGGQVNRATLKPHNKNNNDGWLQAWDPVARKVVWETPRGPRATSGAMATAGNLVFMGNSGGKKLAAYNAKDGTKLWEFDAQTDVYAAPITYELDGVQYIAASVGGTGQGDYFAPSYGRMLVFKVGGTAKLPPNAPFTPRLLNPPALTASPEVVATGNRIYAENCAVCHGPNATPGRGGNGPNLTTTPFLHSQAGFDQVVLQGASVDRGMLNFGDKLRPADSAAVLAYIVSRANEVKNNPPAPGGFGGPRGGGRGGGPGGPGADGPGPGAGGQR
jgi:mono/diheme cytochrome c family protein